MRAPGQTSVQALSAPRNPSVTSTSGAGIRENNAAYASFDSCEHHWKPSASPVSPSTATIRHQSWLMYVPSAITVWCLTAGVGISGRMFQHHDVRLRNMRGPDPISPCVLPESSQSRKARRSASCLRSGLGAVVPREQSAHFQRCVPAAVLPFFLIGRPHTGHSRALFDFVLIRPSNRQGTVETTAFNTTSY